MMQKLWTPAALTALSMVDSTLEPLLQPTDLASSPVRLRKLSAVARSIIPKVEGTYWGRSVITHSALVAYAARFCPNPLPVQHEYSPLLFCPLVAATTREQSPQYTTNAFYHTLVDNAAQDLANLKTVVVCGLPRTGKSTFIADVLFRVPNIPAVHLLPHRLADPGLNPAGGIDELHHALGVWPGILVVDPADAISWMSSTISKNVAGVFQVNMSAIWTSGMLRYPYATIIATDSTTSIPAYIAEIATYVETPIAGVPIPERKTSCIMHSVVASSIEEAVLRKVIGQDSHVKSMARTLELASCGLRVNPNGPMMVAFVMGPTGVGKTLTAHTLADTLGRKLVSIGMQEYSHDHAVAGLIGSPPGYVGYGEGGILTNAVLTDPGCVLLLDEFEKAAPKVVQTFLGLFDYGILKSAAGIPVDFRNTIIIMTSNVGSSELQSRANRAPMGFTETFASSTLDILRAALNNTFSPEFVNRIDLVLAFDPLPTEVLRQIASIQLQEVVSMLKSAKGVEITWTPEVLEWIIDNAQSDNVDTNGRSIRRVVRGSIANIAWAAIGTGTHLLLETHKNDVRAVVRKQKTIPKPRRATLSLATTPTTPTS